MMRACATAVAALWIAGATAAAAEVGATSKTHVVVIENMRFDPQTLTARSGDRIIWINKDLVPHTATADAGKFDSHTLAPNASWTFVVEKPGNFPYVCAFHPTMTATLTVE